MLRTFLAGLAVLLLAWIGRSAAANGTRPPLFSIGSPSSASGAVLPVHVATPMVSLFADGGLPPPALPPIGSAPPTPASPEAPPSSPPTPSSSARASPEAPVYINHASVDELRRLPGVGAKRAEAIRALRQRLGRFHRVEDLLRVKGVGRTTLKKWRPLVRLDAPPSAGDAGT